jgi:uncharacterized protein (TIGR02646 family)
MIKIKRSKKPNILIQKAQEWTKTLLTIQKENDNAQKKYQSTEIKEALVKMCHDKCAYCESKVRHVDYGHIEHYRPKSKYPELTFEWSNLLLACGICNSKAYKGDKFPEKKEGGPLINPCKDVPERHFNFYYDFKTGIASVFGTTQRGQISEKLLGLNRHELRQYRSEYVRKLYVLIQLSDIHPDAKALVEEAKQNNAEYAAFIRQLTK